MIDEKGLEAARRRYPVALQEACDLGKFPEHRMRYAVKEAITAYLSASAEPVAWCSKGALKMAAAGLPAIIHAYPPPVDPVALYRRPKEAPSV